MLQGCASIRVLWAMMPGGTPASGHKHTSSSLHPRSLPSSRSGLCCSNHVGVAAATKGCFWGCMGARWGLDSKQCFIIFFGVLSTNTALLRSAMVLRAERMWKSCWWEIGSLTLPAPSYFPVLAILWNSCCPRGHSPELPLNPFVAYV